MHILFIEGSHSYCFTNCAVVATLDSATYTPSVGASGAAASLV